MANAFLGTSALSTPRLACAKSATRSLTCPVMRGPRPKPKIGKARALVGSSARDRPSVRPVTAARTTTRSAARRISPTISDRLLQEPAEQHVLRRRARHHGDRVDQRDLLRAHLDAVLRLAAVGHAAVAH